MRALDIGLTALALRTAPERPRKPERGFAPAIDDAEGADLDRAGLDQERLALIASLWTAPARQCVVAARYELLPVPAEFGIMWVVSRPLRRKQPTVFARAA